MINQHTGSVLSKDGLELTDKKLGYLFTRYTQPCVALPYDEAYWLGQHFVHAVVSKQLQSMHELNAVLAALNNIHVFRHQDAPEMIAGISAAVFDCDINTSEYKFLDVPGVDHIGENCGMGGDGLQTPNVSCLAAIVAASAGVPMVKHGSRGHTNPSGSTEFLTSCGLRMDLPKEKLVELIQRFGLGYIDAEDTRYKRIHLVSMDYSRVSHVNHIVGPITSPVNPKVLRRRVLGVNQNIDPYMIVKVYQILNEKGVTNMEHLMVVRGYGDDDRVMDEASITSRGSEIVELRHGEVTSRRILPEEFGLKPVPCSQLEIPNNSKKGAYSLGILDGSINGAAADLISANAALLLYLADPSRSLHDCTEDASRLLRSGAAYSHMQKIKEFCA